MKILVGLSGGLDSTYAAYLLREAGHEVVGAAVVMHEYTDVSSAQAVAEALDIPFVVLDRTQAFTETVISRFLADYAAGRTPNPCVLCNPSVKFGALCDYATTHGFDAVATGHYASILIENGRYFIRMAEDGGKDQSYVLWRLSQQQLAMLYLPLAGMKKSDIRASAMALGFACAEAKESQEICFIPDNDYVGYIERALGRSFPVGHYVDHKGNVIGQHQGLIRYTVGQRKGLGVAFGQPMFVAKLDAVANTVMLVPAGGEYATAMTMHELNFMKLAPQSSGTIEATVKVRYAAKPSPCTVTFAENEAIVRFSQPIRAVTPGQSAVIYDGSDVLLGGIIDFTELKD
ncbi:MAG: tRNA 2-thiouridine(34) synthase MnmA [Ruminococcaceae bacterium]|nr:tRNA 2-thiouridine(34) synthase MnmA [Oscillospiraceae bacterium]